jgi:hypothetical protein
MSACALFSVAGVQPAAKAMIERTKRAQMFLMIYFPGFRPTVPDEFQFLLTDGDGAEDRLRSAVCYGA